MDEENSLTSQIATTFQFIVPFQGLLVPEVMHIRLRWTACSRVLYGAQRLRFDSVFEDTIT